MPDPIAGPPILELPHGMTAWSVMCPRCGSHIHEPCKGTPQGPTWGAVKYPMPPTATGRMTYSTRLVHRDRIDTLRLVLRRLMGRPTEPTDAERYARTDEDWRVRLCEPGP